MVYDSDLSGESCTTKYLGPTSPFATSLKVEKMIGTHHCWEKQEAR